jgi:hypothetical protein
MLNKLIYPKDLPLDEKKVACCPPDRDPKQPPSGQDPDCCYNTWQHELNHVNRILADRQSELTYINKHLQAATDRLTRLSTWNSELVLANDLALKMCAQLELIEGQLIVVCRNTGYTRQGIELLVCMVRDFFGTVDELQLRYDRIITCLKALNNTALTLTTGIGLTLSNFGTALTAITAMRDTLIQQVITVFSAAVGLHDQICDQGHGYKKLIGIWRDTLGCNISCEEGFWAADPARKGAPPPNMPDPFWLDPILKLPLCNEGYVFEIAELYKSEKKLVKQLTDDQTRVTGDINHLTMVQLGLTSGIKEVLPSVRYS